MSITASPQPPRPRHHTPYILLSLIAFIFVYALFHPPSRSPTPLPPATAPPHHPTSPDSRAHEQQRNEMATTWFQKTLSLPPSSRGSYLVTDTIVDQLPELAKVKVGLLTLFVQHTSCALSLNENWDSDVRLDMSDALDRIVPYADVGGKSKPGKLGAEKEERWQYRHDAEGDDDMPAHVKSALVGATVTVPITNGRLALGTWQGIWYLEFRTSRHTRKIVATIQGQTME